MKKNGKKRTMSGVFTWMTVMSFLLSACPADKAVAGAPEPVESGTEQEAKSDICQVIFPGDTEHVFDFIMDPQRLISQTNAAAYGGSVFEADATLFFRRRDGGVPEDYSSSSDALVIVNGGTADVELTVTAGISMESMGGICLTDDRNFTDDTAAGLYLALTDGIHTVAIDEEEGASVCTVLKGISEEKESVGEYRFWLTGAVNENGDWTAVEDAVPKVTVTWNVTPCEEDKTEGEHSPEEENIPAEEEALSADEDGAKQEPPVTDGDVEDAELSEKSTDTELTDDLTEDENSEKTESPGEEAIPGEPEISGEGEDAGQEVSEPSGENVKVEEQNQSEQTQFSGEDINSERVEAPAENTDNEEISGINMEEKRKPVDAI